MLEVSPFHQSKPPELAVFDAVLAGRGKTQCCAAELGVKQVGFSSEEECR